jgi:YHS domain-containing protein
MKNLILTMIMAFVAFPAMAADPAMSADSWLKPVEAKNVCMMNDRVFDKEQMAIEVEGKTYYGCCPMCKEMLNKDASKRTAIDPVSKKPVDKAAAVIGADPHGMTYYFENEENFQTYAKGPMPEMKHEHMEGMDMNGMDKTDATKAPAEPLITPEDHKQHH